MLKTLTVQLKPELLGDRLSNKAVQLLEALANTQKLMSHFKVLKGAENEKYINVNFECVDLLNLWASIKESFLTKNPLSPMLKKGAIIICQGENGWEDYLLLYHYDASIQLDELDE